MLYNIRSNKKGKDCAKQQSIMIKTILKFIFATGIIYWLVSSGKLDFNLITKSFNTGYGWLICICSIMIQAVLSAYRWKLILKPGIKSKIPNLAMIKLTWIGLFFNSVLPGAVTGDLIKLVYAKDLDKDVSKTFLVTTVFMDRILGLMGLLTVMGFFSVIYYSDIILLSPKIKPLIHLNFLLFLGAIVFLIILFLPKKFQEKIVSFTDLIPVLGKHVSKTLKQGWLIGASKKVMLYSFLLSIGLQLLNVFSFWIITSPFYGKHVPFSHLVTIIPLGYIAVAVPIAPSGLGVGHLAFDRLFSFVGIEGGAGLFNLYFLCLIFINLLGFFPYILSGKRHSLSETHQFDDVGK